MGVGLIDPGSEGLGLLLDVELELVELDDSARITAVLKFDHQGVGGCLENGQGELAAGRGAQTAGERGDPFAYTGHPLATHDLDPLVVGLRAHVLKVKGCTRLIPPACFFHLRRNR